MIKNLSEILIASNNSGKISEISQLLDQHSIKSIAPSSLGLQITEPEETSDTFAGNALIKAKYYGHLSSKTSLSDDSGLCIKALDGAPGVHSARFAVDDNGNKNFNFAFDKILTLLKNYNLDPENDLVEAYFICNLCLYNPASNSYISFEGRVDGRICGARGNKGFGYDPIFIKNGMSLSFGQIDAYEKEKISHRALAFNKLIDWLKKNKNI